MYGDHHDDERSPTPCTRMNRARQHATTTPSPLGISMGIHCPRAGSGRAKAIFAGPDPGPQGRATLSLALARGQLDPGPLGSGQGRARADPGPLICKSK